LKIVNAGRFDDVGDDFEYVCRGFNYVIQDEESFFHIRMYNDEARVATLVNPTKRPASDVLRRLIVFLQSELNVDGFFLYRGELGQYAAIDLKTLEFREFSLFH